MKTNISEYTIPERSSAEEPPLPVYHTEIPRRGFTIIRASHYGMCFGVRDALTMAEESSLHEPSTILGELVHNGIVQDKLVKLGTLTGKLDDKSARTENVIITAHGASNKDMKRWKSNGYKITNTTCPLVHRAHQTLEKLVSQGLHPVVIGKKNHAEVNGLSRDQDGCIIIESIQDIEVLDTSTHYGIVSQTTQTIDHVECILKELDHRGILYTFKDTVCKPTKDRQKALNKLIEECDFILAVGGKNSNNTNQLVRKARLQGIDSMRIESPSEIDPRWFIGKKKVGITAGTSTLLTSVDDVVAFLKNCGGIEE